VIPERTANTRIFLSYRREDSADVVGRIFDHLERRFGRDCLFLDIDASGTGKISVAGLTRRSTTPACCSRSSEIAGSMRQTKPDPRASGGSTIRTIT
jgi:hypothetical protein